MFCNGCNFPEEEPQHQKFVMDDQEKAEVEPVQANDAAPQDQEVSKEETPVDEKPEEPKAEEVAPQEEAPHEEPQPPQPESIDNKAVEREQVVNDWCKKHGFTGVNDKKDIKKCMGSKSMYPLHYAVETNSVRIAENLVAQGADKKLKNSKGQRPIDLANKLNKKDSHKAIVAVVHI